MDVRKLLLVLLFPVQLLAQDQWKYEYYQQFDHTNFRNFAAFRQSVSSSHPDIPLLDAAIFFLTNEQRVKNNLKPLPYHAMLEVAAYHHSLQMATTNFFSHTNPVTASRASTTDRGKLAGVANPYFAENIAMNTATSDTYIGLASKLVTQWMNSTGHRENILSQKGLQMGCGAYFTGGTVYATQVFQWFYLVEEMPEGGVDKLPSSGQGNRTNAAPSPVTNTNRAPSPTDSNTTNNTTLNPDSNPNSQPSSTKPKSANTTTVPEKQQRSKSKRLQMGVGVQGDYLHGSTEADISPTQSLGFQASAWLGVRLGPNRKSPVVAAFATSGPIASAPMEAYFTDFNSTSGTFFELEGGLLLIDALRISGGVGAIAGTSDLSAPADSYYCGTIGYGLGRNTMKFNVAVTVMSGDATGNKILIRPAAGMTIRLNFLKI